MAACPGCAQPQPEGAKFCFSCGTALSAPTCASCGAGLVPGARFCGECGAPQAGGSAATPPASPAVPAASAQPVAARRVTSVLFGDLVGFTSLSESRDQEEVRELLGRYFEECRQVIGRYGGTVEKFIGDAVMAVWGVPTAHEDDAERAVRAGLELVDVVEVLGQQIGVPELAMRVGIVTGEVAVTVGAEQQGMVAGDAVNTASRVQSIAESGQVWVDESTRLLTSSAITYVDAGSHRLKGKIDPVPLWAVHAVVAAVGGAQRADGLEAPLAGRDRELRLIKELFHASAEAGQPSLLVMVGEPGTGKSRLAWEFDKYVDGLTQTVRWHTGRCVAYGEGTAFFALAEAIRARLRSLRPELEDEAARDPGEPLELGLTRYVPDEEERSWLEPRVGELLGTGAAGSFAREDLFAAWTTFLERVHENSYPVVLVIDDAHHADDGLIAFTEHLLATARFPCFVVLLGRPALLERHPGLAVNRRATVSHLAPLTEQDIASLLDGLVVGLPEGIRGALVARAEGVPLYAVETVRSLIDKDLVVPRGGQYVLADPAALDLDAVGAPASLQALVAARLDALGPLQRRVVERASVIGTSFSREQLDLLCPDVEELSEVLDGLVRQQILSRLNNKFSGEYGQHQFVQSVVRQVAYAALSRRDRRALHLAVARMTEAEPDSSGELAAIIAQHYRDAIAAMPDETDVPDLEARVIAELERAAGRARSLGAMSDSAGHLVAALELAKEPATRAGLQFAAAQAMVDAGDYDRALDMARAACAVFDEHADTVSAGRAAALQGMALAGMGDFAGAFEVVDPRWSALVDDPGADLALLALGRVLGSTITVGRADDDPEEIERAKRDVLDRWVQIAEKLGDREELAHALTGLSAAYSARGAADTALILMTAAADIARAEHFPVALARCLTNLTVELAQRDLAKAIEHGREGVEVADRAGVALVRDYTLVNLLLALLAAGEWDDLVIGAESVVDGSSVLTAPTAAVLGYVGTARGEPYRVPWEGEAPVGDDPADVAWCTFAESFQSVSAGAGRAAVAQAVRAVETMHRDSGLSDDFVHMWPHAVELAMAEDDAATVERLLGIVDDDRARLRVPMPVHVHRTRFAGLLLRGSDPTLAEAKLRAAHEGFVAWGARPYAAVTQAELALLLRAQGAGEEADELFRRAREQLLELGALGWLARLDAPPVSSAGPVAGSTA